MLVRIETAVGGSELSKFELMPIGHLLAFVLSKRFLRANLFEADPLVGELVVTAATMDFFTSAC